MRLGALAFVIWLVFASPASAAPPLGADGRTAPVYDYLQAVRERVFIPQPGIDQDRNGVTDRITVDIIRPQESGAQNRMPAIVDPGPYFTTLCRGNETECLGDTDGDGVNDLWPLFVDNYFLPRGYAYVIAQMNGTGYTTDGCPHHGGAGDIAGEKSVIDWLNGRVPGYDKNGVPKVASWHNGSSAMLGKSYDGTLANGVAATGVDGLKTIVPIAAISDWYAYSRWGGIRQNNNYPAQLNGAVTYNPTVRPGLSLPDRRPVCAPVNADFNNWDGDETGDYNGFWDERNYLEDVGNVEAAVFAVHGIQDDNVRMDHLWWWWNGLEATGVPRKLWLLRSGHTDPFDSRRAAWIDTLHRWFDHWLYGVDNGIEDEPPVTIEDERDVWKEYASWPIPGTVDVPVFLRGTSQAEAGVLRGVSGGPLDGVSFTNTSQASGAVLGASVETAAITTPAGSQANRRVFLSRPLVRDVRLSGRAVVELQASLNAMQSNLGAILVDYGPEPFNQVTRTSEGTQNGTTETCLGPQGAADRRCWREVTKPLQSVTQWRVTRGILDSSNRSSLRSTSPLTLGQSYAFSIPTQPTEHTFAAGHQIGVVIVGNLFGIAGTPGAQITVDTRLSRIQLPIAGGVPAARASGLTDESAPATAAPAGGWTRSNRVTLTGDDGDGTGVARLTYSTTGAVVTAPVTVQGATASLDLGSDGATTVRFSATDAAGNVEAEKTATVQLDTAAPSVTLTSPSATVFARGEVVTARYACADGGSGVASCPPAARVATATAGSHALTATATDVAGNAQALHRPYTVLGRLPKLGVRRRGGLKLTLTSRVRATVRLSGTLKRSGAKVGLRPLKVSLQPGVARAVTLRRVRTLSGAGRPAADVVLATAAGALRRTDRVRFTVGP